ncbi:MAG: uroporphyrinogen-III C-methyltransferase [Thermodesulfobacteria bacterium]|nr:uroporphyrinogen-III C-methyltransferase [Thermodesulfobacteriota bacterium]
MAGKVYLVGAGPGDPGLFTLKGKEALEKADVVIYDYLANPELLKFCKKDAELIYVGKKGGCHTLSQEGINELLKKEALEGKIVVRLKGGDPFLFGRGGEEVEALLEVGAEFEVIPGITSAIAVPAYAGIPVTHRNFTSTLAIITGHEAEGKPESKIDFTALAKIGTLVFLMGVKNLPRIIENLVKEGKSEDTPVAVIQWGTLPKQKVATGTLKNIVDEVKKLGIKAPAIIIVGEVVKLREKFMWFEKKPLFGKKVIVTRTRQQASKLIKELESLGAMCYEVPVIKISPIVNDEVIATIKRVEDYDWLVFTSENGVKCFFDVLFSVGKDVRALGGLKIATIGPATFQALKNFGINPDLLPDKEFKQEGIIEKFASLDIKGKKVLVPRAKVARAELIKGLENLGARVQVLPVYETLICEESAPLLKSAIDDGAEVVTFTSSSTVKNFFSLAKDIPSERLKSLIFASIGPITSATLREYGYEPQIEAKEYTIKGLVEAMVKYFSKEGE